jgi:hypothetical protein
MKKMKKRKKKGKWGKQRIEGSYIGTGGIRCDSSSPYALVPD